MNLRKFTLLFLPILIIVYGVFFGDLSSALDELLKDPCEYHPDFIVYSITVSPTGEVWVITNNVLLEFDGENWQSHVEPAINFNALPIGFIEFDREGRLWLGGDEGIMIYDGENWMFHNVEELGLPRTMVTSIAFDPEGQAWVGLARSWESYEDDPGGGISIFDGETWTTIRTLFDNSTTNDDISTIQFDPQGHPWVGTFNGTVAVIEEIVSFSQDSESLSSLSLLEENLVSSTTDEDGVTHFTAFSAKTYHRNSFPSVPSGYQGKVHSINFDNKGDAWIYIHKNLYRFDGEGFEFMQSTEWDSMGNVTIDPQGNIWFGLKVYDGNQWKIYDAKNSCIGSTVRDVAFDHSGTAWVAHNPFHNKIGLTTFENRPDRIPSIFLGLRTILLPQAPVFRWIVPAILAGIWLIVYMNLKISWASIAKLGSRLRVDFSFQENHLHDKKWFQAVLAGMPYLIFYIWIEITPIIWGWLRDLETMYKGNSFDFLFFLPFLIIIPFVIIGWKKGWPVWSGSWVGFGIIFLFYSRIFPSMSSVIVPAGILLLIWLYFQDQKPGVLATLPLTLIVGSFLYRDIYRVEFFIQILLEVLSLTSFFIIFIEKWTWPAVGGLLLVSSVSTYALMNYNSFQGQSPYLPWIPTDPGASLKFFLLSLFLFLIVTFLPLLLLNKLKKTG